MDEIHRLDSGTDFEFEVYNNGAPADLSSATVKRFKFRKPDFDQTRIVRDAQFLTDGTDGILYYRFDDDELDILGPWEAEVYLEFLGWKGHTSIVTFEVCSIIEDP